MQRNVINLPSLFGIQEPLFPLAYWHFAATDFLTLLPRMLDTYFESEILILCLKFSTLKNVFVALKYTYST